MKAFHSQLTQHRYVCQHKNNDSVQLQHFLLGDPETKNLAIYFDSKI
jgi:hypothetical protein